MTLFKLVWHPDNLNEDGQVTPSAFRSDDLSGKQESHSSVDRADIAKREVMERVAEGQAAKADGEKIMRKLALIGTLNCGSIRMLRIGEGHPLQVSSFPLPENDAHCGIHNVSGQKGRGFITELRTKLAAMTGMPMTFDQAYGE